MPAYAIPDLPPRPTAATTAAASLPPPKLSQQGGGNSSRNHRGLSSSSSSSSSASNWSTGGPSNGKTYNTYGDPRKSSRGKYSTSSHNNNNNNSSNNSNSNSNSSNHSNYYSSNGGSSSHSYPSPATSTTSTASSLRTPPDLLLNGGSLASSLTSSYVKSGGKGYGPWKGQEADKKINHLTLSELSDRMKLISSLSHDAIPLDIPSPPSSPKAKPQALKGMSAKEGSSTMRKRKMEEGDRDDVSSDEKDSVSSRSTATKRVKDGRTGLTKMSSSSSGGKAGDVGPRSSRDLSTSSSLAVSSRKIASSRGPPPREWTKERFLTIAAMYRHRGRELKHRGDQRFKEASTNLPSSSRSLQSDDIVAALEQTDALLLYAYGFWCEDQAGGATCVAANWNSLFGLLKYVYAAHERFKLTILSGLCRLLEAVVLRHVANHELRLLNHRLSKVATSALPSASPGSPSSNTDLEPPSESASAILQDLSKASAHVVSLNERAVRLFAEARQTVLNLDLLRTAYPALAEQCISSTFHQLDQPELALRLDPSDVPKRKATEDSVGVKARWSWPIDQSTPFPILICFGRSLLRESSRELKLDFWTDPVSTTYLSKP